MRRDIWMRRDFWEQGGTKCPLDSCKSYAGRKNKEMSWLRCWNPRWRQNCPQGCGIQLIRIQFAHEIHLSLDQLQPSNTVAAQGENTDEVRLSSRCRRGGAKGEGSGWQSCGWKPSHEAQAIPEPYHSDGEEAISFFLFPIQCCRQTRHRIATGTFDLWWNPSHLEHRIERVADGSAENNRRRPKNQRHRPGFDNLRA